MISKEIKIGDRLWVVRYIQETKDLCPTCHRYDLVNNPKPEYVVVSAIFTIESDVEDRNEKTYRVRSISQENADISTEEHMTYYERDILFETAAEANTWINDPERSKTFSDPSRIWATKKVE